VDLRLVPPVDNKATSGQAKAAADMRRRNLATISWRRRISSVTRDVLAKDEIEGKKKLFIILAKKNNGYCCTRGQVMMGD